jgi:hypothetical protein
VICISRCPDQGMWPSPPRTSCCRAISVLILQRKNRKLTKVKVVSAVPYLLLLHIFYAAGRATETRVDLHVSPGRGVTRKAMRLYRDGVRLSMRP